jgi:uncharacterized membrane protein
MPDSISDNKGTGAQGAPLLPQFAATLLPHRSLSRKGFVALLLAVGGASAAIGTACALMGAWPVTGFSGITVLLVFAAFRLNYKAGRLSERILLGDRELRVTRTHPSGETESWSFNPYWVRFQHLRSELDEGELSLTCHGRKLVFGAFLSGSEKSSLAAALAAALARQNGHPSRHFKDI